MDFCKCQGCPLLTALSAPARSTLRHFEVAACLEHAKHSHSSSEDDAPCAAPAAALKGFLYVAVTDWKLLLVTLPSAQQRPQLLLELPLVELAHVEVEERLDAAAELRLSGAGGGVVLSDRMSIWLLPKCPRHAPWQQQQQRRQPAVGDTNIQQADTMLAALKQQLSQDRRQPPAGQADGPVSAGAAECKTSAPWQHAAPHSWQLRSVPEAACCETQSSGGGVLVQHLRCSSGGGARGGDHRGSASACTGDATHFRHHHLSPCFLRLLTVERSSRLVFHLQRAWMGAHMRAALAAAGAPGLRSWAPPGIGPAAAPTAMAAGGAAVLGLAQRRQSQVDILVLPSPRQHSIAAGCQCADHSSSSRPQTEPARAACSATAHQPHLLQAGSAGQLPGRPTHRPSVLQRWAPGAWRAAAAAMVAAAATAAASSRPLSRDNGVVAGLATRVDSGSGSGSSFSMAWLGAGAGPARERGPRASSLPPSTGEGGASLTQRPFSRGQQRVLRDTLQEGAELLMEPATSAAWQLLWEIADALSSPCSLFEAGDCVVLQRLMLELASARQEQAAALQVAFFSSEKMLAFILGRLTSWCSLMSLFSDGLPPIQNPAQPGSIEVWAGRPVVWTTHLTYPGRPQQLLKALGLTQRSSICFRAAFKAAAMIAQRHQQAAAFRAAARTSANSSSSSSSTAGGASSLPQAYPADPLHLSPLLATSYPFVTAAQRMLAGSHSRLSNSGGGGSAAAVQPGAGGGYDLSAEGTLAEATSVLRWERLAGRLAARIARRKVALLLQMLQLHLAFSEGCAARALWLSHKGLSTAAPAAEAVQPEPWTFRDATKQVIALLLTMHIHGVRTNLAAAAAAAAAATGSAATASAAAAQSSCSASERTPLPQGAQDFLWWARCDDPDGDSSAGLLDSIVGVLFELSGLAQDRDRLHNEAAVGAVIQVVRGVPESCLHPVLRAVALRFVGLMTGTAAATPAVGSSGGAGAVLAHRYGSVLLEVLGGVAGCAAELAAAIGVEVQHLMAAPAVEAQLAAAAAACNDSVLAAVNERLLARVLAAVRAAPASAGLQDRQAVTMEGLRLPGARASGGASFMKVQN